MYVAEKEKNGFHGDAPSFFTCISFLLPNAEFYKSSVLDDLMANMSRGIQENFSFLKNITMDTQFSGQMKERWDKINEYLRNPDVKLPCVSCKAKKVLDDIQGEIDRRWREFQVYAGSSSADDNSETAGNSSQEKQHNKFEEYVNKTKESVNTLSRKIENTWHKVKNLSKDFLKKKDQTIDVVSGTVSESFGAIKDHVNKGWKRMEKQFDWGKRGHKHHKHKHHKHKRHQHGPRGPDYSSRHAPYEPPFVTDDRGDFERRPPHKQKQSSPDANKYEEFWKHVHFDPDDVIHEGFFEGNQREWQKHQRTLRNLHGRVEKLNENLFMDMDDDDIEDMYDDFEDFEDDIEDKKEQPEGLKTWLSCQLRWWKSRIQRKKRQDQLVTECGRHLMNWQLRATCSPQCEHYKCRKHASKLNKVCQSVMLTQGKPQTANNQHNHKVFHKVTGDKDKRGSVTSQHGQLRYHVTHDVSDVDDDDVSVNETYYELDDVSSWYFRRVHGREDERTPPPQWLFDRMEDREDQRKAPSWMFERAEGREYSRNKPWYEKRADNRRSRLNIQHDTEGQG